MFGGEHAPYFWLRTPDGLSSWDFFDALLVKTHVVGSIASPGGAGHGPGAAQAGWPG